MVSCKHFPWQRSVTITFCELHKLYWIFLLGQAYLKHLSALLGGKTVRPARFLKIRGFGLLPKEPKYTLHLYYFFTAEWKRDFQTSPSPGNVGPGSGWQEGRRAPLSPDPTGGAQESPDQVGHHRGKRKIFFFLILRIWDFTSPTVNSANPKRTPRNSNSTLAPRTGDNMWFRWGYEELTKQWRLTPQSWKQAFLVYLGANKNVPPVGPTHEDTMVMMMP